MGTSATLSQAFMGLGFTCASWGESANGVRVIQEFKIQEIEDGVGKINADKYELRITKLPLGKTAQDLFNEIRSNFELFAIGTEDTVLGLPLNSVEFEPYSDKDKTLWESTDPVGAAMNFYTLADTATVIATEFSQSEMFWTFTTVRSIGHLGHPVSGHRQFRLRENEDGSHTFVVRGADRLNTPIDFTANIVLGFGIRDFAFDLADDTWKNLMKTIEKLINSMPGAKVEPFDKTKEYGTRHNYNDSDCK